MLKYTTVRTHSSVGNKDWPASGRATHDCKVCVGRALEDGSTHSAAQIKDE